MSGKSDINERLQEIDEDWGEINVSVFSSPYLRKASKDIQWMHDTIKQLQEENESLNNLVDKLEIGIKRQSVKHGEAKKRIEELERTYIPRPFPEVLKEIREREGK